MDSSPQQVDINSILKSLNSSNEQQTSSKPNIKMTIKNRNTRRNNNATRNNSSTRNNSNRNNSRNIVNRKRSKVVRCKGTLVNRNGQMVPKVKCSSKSIYGNNRSNSRNNRSNSRNTRSNRRYNRRNNNLNMEELMPVNFGVHGENTTPKSKEALSEIIGEITKLRRNNQYYNSLKNKNRKKALENMILKNIIKNQRVKNLRPKKSCRKKFKIVQVPVNDENMNHQNTTSTSYRNLNRIGVDPDLKKILKQVQHKHNKSGKKGKCRVIAKAKYKSL